MFRLLLLLQTILSKQQFTRMIYENQWFHFFYLKKKANHWKLLAFNELFYAKIILHSPPLILDKDSMLLNFSFDILQSYQNVGKQIRNSHKGIARNIFWSKCYDKDNNNSVNWIQRISGNADRKAKMIQIVNLIK